MLHIVFRGVKDALGTPALGLGLSMLAFGAYLKASGFNIYQSFLSTFFAFALPGQYVMTETLLAGGNLFNIFFAVLLTNIRLFPMTIYLMPILQNKSKSKFSHYILSHLIAVTSWINMLKKQNKVKQSQKFNYFLGMGGVLWLISIIATVVGYLLSDILEKKLLVALVFFNPLYFLIMTVITVDKKHLRITFILSIITFPLLYQFTNDWSILLAGILSGTIGFLFFEGKNE